MTASRPGAISCMEGSMKADEERAAAGEGRALDAVVEAREVSRQYGDGDTAVQALRGVSLAVERSKLTAIMGPSGSGKSTLMHILAGLDKPDRKSTRLNSSHVAISYAVFC